MTALRVVETTEASADPVVRWLEATLSRLGAEVAQALAGDAEPATDADRIDRIARLEAVRSGVAALQAAECVQLARSQAIEQLARDVHPREIGRGVAEQIALASKTSPTIAARKLGAARAWWFELPHTYAALTEGRISERVAEDVSSETRHLDPTARAEVDRTLAEKGLDTLGPRDATTLARQLAYEADPEGYLARGRTERQHRRVGLRPAPDTMAVLSGYLPVEQGVACFAALKKHTDSVKAVGDVRTRDQIMADTLVERLTGQTQASDVAVEITLVVPLDTLIDPSSSRTATVTGAGPLPAGLVDEIVAGSSGAKSWRQVYASGSGHVVNGDQRRRRFTGSLAGLITVRDQSCRDPYCGAPIRHQDHVQRYADGGPTTFENGRGTCARHNLVRELPGWSVRTVHDGLGVQPHTVQVTTPTGHTYLSRTPDPP